MSRNIPPGPPQFIRKHLCSWAKSALQSEREKVEGWGENGELRGKKGGGRRWNDKWQWVVWLYWFDWFYWLKMEKRALSAKHPPRTRITNTRHASTNHTDTDTKLWAEWVLGNSPLSGEERLFRTLRKHWGEEISAFTVEKHISMLNQ